MHLVNGYDLPIAKFQRLHYILRGIKRIKGASTRTRLPVTLDHLKLFHRILHSRASPTHDEIMIWAAITTAFFGFLRIGEMTCSGLFNSSTHLSRSDVSFHDKTNDHEAFLNLRISFKDRPVSILNHDYHRQHFRYNLSRTGTENIPFTNIRGPCRTTVLLLKRYSFIS